MLKRAFREYLNFSRREQNGILILISLIVILLLIRLAINILPQGNDIDPEEIEHFISDIEKLEKISEKGTAKDDQEDDSIISSGRYEMFPFDPNVASEEDWLKLGLPERVITTIFHYIESGGRFYKKEDLRKIYGLSERIYQRLEPYIQIGFQAEDGDHLQATRKANQSDPEPVELNSADTLDLIPLKGIGPVLARRILKYRNLLGGFYRKEQLLEVYGLSSVTFSEIATFIEIDTLLVKKMDLNRCTFANLIRHPYFDEELTKTILDYREEHRKFRSVSDLLETDIVSKEAYIRIRPYIRVDSE